MERLARPLSALAVALIAIAMRAPERRALAEPQAAANGARWTRLAADSYLERARVALAHGDTIAAISAFSEALRIDPTLGAAYLGLAEIRCALGDVDEGERLLSRASVLSDVRAEALTRRARLYESEARSDLAGADFEAAVAVEPTPTRLRELARFYATKKAWSAALEQFRRLRVEHGLALSESELKDTDETLRALAALAAEADAVQHDLGDRNWVRRALSRHALPSSPASATRRRKGLALAR